MQFHNMVSNTSGAKSHLRRSRHPLPQVTFMSRTANLSCGTLQTFCGEVLQTWQRSLFKKKNPCGIMKRVVFHADAALASPNGIERIVNWHWGKPAMQRNFGCWPYCWKQRVMKLYLYIQVLFLYQTWI